MVAQKVNLFFKLKNSCSPLYLNNFIPFECKIHYNLTLSGPAFSVVRQAKGENQPTDSHKSIPDAKFEDDSSSSFGDMTSQNFPQKKGTSHQIRPFTPRKRF